MVAGLTKKIIRLTNLNSESSNSCQFDLTQKTLYVEENEREILQNMIETSQWLVTYLLYEALLFYKLFQTKLILVTFSKQNILYSISLLFSKYDPFHNQNFIQPCSMQATRVASVYTVTCIVISMHRPPHIDKLICIDMTKQCREWLIMTFSVGNSLCTCPYLISSV